MELGEKIKTLRKGKYTQEELAEKIGVHINTLVRWEKNYRYPTADKLKALADALDTTTDYLMSDDAVQSVESEKQGAEMKISEEKSEDILPYTKEEEKLNRGMLSFTLKDGTKVDMPPTRESYDFLEKIISRATRVAVL